VTLEDRQRLNGFVEHIVEKRTFSGDDLVAEIQQLVAVSARRDRAV